MINYAYTRQFFVLIQITNNKKATISKNQLNNKLRSFSFTVFLQCLQAVVTGNCDLPDKTKASSLFCSLFTNISRHPCINYHLFSEIQLIAQRELFKSFIFDPIKTYNVLFKQNSSKTFILFIYRQKPYGAVDLMMKLSKEEQLISSIESRKCGFL